MVNIVVVDDEERIRQGLAKLIEQAGPQFRVTGIFGSGLEVLSQIASLDADLVITDIKMPKMTGLELIEKLQPDFPHLRFAIVSGFDDFAYARQALRFGVAEYLLKPVDKGELEQLLLKVDEGLQKSGQQVSRDDQIKLLALNDPDTLPKPLRQEVCRELDETPAFRQPFAFFLVRGSEPLQERALASVFPGGLKPIELEGQTALIASLNHTDHAERVRETGETLLARLPNAMEARIGASGVFLGSSYLREAYRQAEAALQQAWYGPFKTAFADYGHLQKKPHSAASFFSLLDREFKEAVEAFDDKRAIEAIRRWIGDFAAGHPSWQELREGCETALALIRGQGPEREARVASFDPSCFAGFEAFAKAFVSEAEEELRALRESRQGNRAIEAVKAYVQLHYREELELNKVAEEVFLTPSYLSKLFKTETGETITDYLISYRIEKAKELLREKNGFKTYAIGEMVGYPDPAYFNKVFKKVAGTTPKEFRDRVR